MMEFVGDYYGDPFKVDQGVTQGDPLSTMIFNVVLDVVVRHCLLLMVEEEDGPEFLGMEIHRKESLFYTDIGLISPS